MKYTWNVDVNFQSSALCICMEMGVWIVSYAFECFMWYQLSRIDAVILFLPVLTEFKILSGQFVNHPYYVVENRMLKHSVPNIDLK